MAYRETIEILKLWEALARNGEEAVLATVIATEGSSYRLPGARLLLAQDGRRAGSVSGGCLEEDLSRKAWWYTENGATVQRYDTNAEGEIGAPFGLGCNGVVHVHLQRVGPANGFVFQKLAAVRQTRKVDNLPFLVGDRTVWTELLTPPIRLLVFGAGADAIPLTEAAALLGWEVHITDGRMHYARAERFPHAASVVVRSAGEHLGFEQDEWTAGVVMSHSYSQDLANLRLLLHADLPYVGVLGPRRRTEEMLQELHLESSSNLFSPMGLDLGSDGPEEVALAVVSEIRATFSGRAGGQLRNGKGSIH